MRLVAMNVNTGGARETCSVLANSGNSSQTMAPEDTSPSPGPQPESCRSSATPTTSGDVQRFDGKIVYNPDGSAYIIDTADDELPMDTEPGSIVDGRGMDSAAVAASVLPKIAAAFYISRSPALYSALYGQAYSSVLLENSKMTEVPVVHSYRVFSVREDGNFERTPTEDVNQKLKLPMVDYSTVPIKPILMCFICKLSFGSVKTFVAHAMSDHGVALNDEERDILSQRNTSAILSSMGRDRHAGVSFLEPMRAPQSRVAGSEASATRAQPIPEAPSIPISRDNHRGQLCLPNVPSSSAGVDLSLKCPSTSVTVSSAPEAVSPPTTASLLHSLSTPMSSQSTSVPTVTGTTIGACPQHMSGRPADEECMECDQIMSFTRSLGGQMAMMHSRNSCKTLKCPKCNWHYKYQETLEIHMKEKHPDNETTCIYCITGQPHPRLARGETYTCGYKPYRCEVCNYSTTTKGNLSIHMQSDKHLNNMQELQNGGVSRDSQRPPSGHGQCPTPQSRSPIQVSPLPAKPKQTFRCDVCNYETNVARNLRIHMTSEKHTHNIMVMQQNVKQIHQLSALQAQMSGVFDPAAMMQFQAALMAADKAPTGGQEAALADLAFNQALMYQMMTAGAGQNMPPAVSMHHEPHHHPLEQTIADRLESPQEPADLNPCRVFTCCTCSCYSSDSVEEIVRHLGRDRSQTRDADVMMVVGGNSICKLCSYKTNLKANFQLHCKTDKHLQKLQHLNHIFEGGESNEWKLRYLNITNPVQLRCNLCEFFTNSVHKLQVHASQQRHEISLVLFSYLRRAELVVPESRRTYNCALCRFSTNQKLPLLQHIRSPQHLQMEQLRQLQRQAEGHQGQDDISAIFPVRQLDDSSEDGAATSCGQNETGGSSTLEADEARRQSGGGGGDTAGLSCPLCVEKCETRSRLEQHLLEAHRAREEVIQRLMMLVDVQDGSKANESCSPSSKPSAAESERTRHEQAERDSIDVDETESEEVYRCQTCSQNFCSVDDLCQHQHEHGMFDLKQTPRGPGYMCSKKGCNQYFSTVQQMEIHFREVHAKTEQIAAVSERHVYKYRCSQCSLAFKTMDKLQMHSQYHMIRDASKCSICDRSFRSVLGLHKHLETSHADVGEEELERHKAKLLSNPVLLAGLSGQVMEQQHRASDHESATSASAAPEDVEDEHDDMTVEQRLVEDRLNSPSAAEDGYSDPNRKYKCHRCRVAYTRQAYLMAHNKTLLHRRGDKLSYPMEKYLDPNRPFKCDVCKESFTQKNILLVHYNSVSHLHKLKKSMQENHVSSQAEFMSQVSTNSNKESEDKKKAFRCNICKVAYGQSQTLDIHIRSVLHQTRAARVPELIAAGAIDTSKPLIDVPDNSQHDQQRRALEALIGLSAQEAPPATPEPVINELPTCQRCSAVFITADQLHQHQHLYCTSKSPNPNVLTSLPMQSDVSLLQQRQEEQNSQRTQVECQELEGSETIAPAEGDALAKREETASPCFSDLIDDHPKTSTPIRRTSHIHKRLLQTYGFEIVMQYNESLHRPKISSTENSESVMQIHPSEEQFPSETWKAQVSCHREHQVPELSKCICPVCKKEFSSIWVLKAHSEEIHNTVVPRDVLDEYADKFKDEFIKKHNLQNEPLNIRNYAEEKKDEATTVESRSEKLNDSRVSAQSSSDQQETSPKISTLTLSMESQNTSAHVSISPPSVASARAPSVPPSAQQQPTSPQQQQPQQNLPDMAAALNLIQAAHMHHQMQQQMNPLMMAQFASMGFPMGAFNPTLAAMNLQPPLMPMMSPQQMFDPMAILAAQAQALAQQQQHIQSAPQHKSLVNPMLDTAMLQHQLATPVGPQQKRARTRITDEQLKILRAHFDINNSPSEDQINTMAQQTGLMPKVIKHWFRNTLFKERQRNKDSPYNFSVPPATTLNLEEYEKTGEAKVVTLNTGESLRVEQKGPVKLESIPLIETQSLVIPQERVVAFHSSSECIAPITASATTASPHTSTTPRLSSPSPSPASFSGRVSPCNMSLSNMLSSKMGQNVSSNITPSKFSPTYQNNMYNQSSLFSGMSGGPSACSYSQSPVSPATSVGSQSGHGKRANRTRFTDYQIKVLQEFFENNAYPKDDDLEYLSKLLSLSPRVIVVWFQNARQKARKVFENQPPVEAPEDMSGRFQRTAGLNYQCKKCLMVFQRYYELIRHQKQHCYKDEDAKKSAQAQAAASQVAFAMSEDSNSNPAIKNASTSSPITADVKLPEQEDNSFKCDKCCQEFSRFDLWREHQVIHLMNPSLFSNTSVVENEVDLGNLSFSVSPKRRASEDEGDHDSGDLPRDKRLRTTITPEQLEFLYQKYQAESNPSRKMLETIAQEIGLRKRVVQVWFQNTRARERKGQFRAHAQVINKRCLFCPAIFKVKSALESHLSSKHTEQYSRGNINIDSLPDVEDDIGVKAYQECSDSDFARTPPAVGLQFDFGHAAVEIPLDLSRPVRSAGSALPERPSEMPLIESSYDRSAEDHGCFMDTRSEPESLDAERSSNTGSPASSTASTILHSQQLLHPLQMPHSRPHKRFRTQMSQIQVKIMKSVFALYKTPTMAECEHLGSEIGLAKRVIQVWFQNARAKGKKHIQVQGVEPEQSAPPEECRYCNFRYSHKYAVQDHIFTRSHLENVRASIESNQKTDGFYGGPTTTSTSAVSVPALPSNQLQTPAEKNDHPLTNRSMSMLLQQMYGVNAQPPSNALHGQHAESESGESGQGTPLRLLQIPPHAAGELRTALLSPGLSTASFTQDGCTAAGLAGVAEIDGDTGAVCKQCHLVFPALQQLERHQQLGSCSAGGVLMLTQLQYQCQLCEQRLTARAEASSHVSRAHGAQLDQTKLATLAAAAADTNGNFRRAAVRGEQ